MTTLGVFCLFFVCLLACLFSLLSALASFLFLRALRGQLPRTARVKESDFTCVYPFEYDEEKRGWTEAWVARLDKDVANLEQALEAIKARRNEADEAEDEEDDLNEYRSA